MEEHIRIAMENKLNDMYRQMEKFKQELQDYFSRPKFKMGDIVVATTYGPIYPSKLVFEVVNVTDMFISGPSTQLYLKHNVRMATDQEAFSYLKQKAIEKGLLESAASIRCPWHDGTKKTVTLKTNNAYLSMDGLQDLLCDGYILYNKKYGWAEVVIPVTTYTFTQSQLAEYLFNFYDFARTSTSPYVSDIAKQFIQTKNNK
jgi:hypothetical protein